MISACFDRGDRLVSVGGLLDEREQTVKREKITGLTLKQSALGRALGCWSMVRPPDYQQRAGNARQA